MKLQFSFVEAIADRRSAAPAIRLRIRATARGAYVEAMVLRARVQIEPWRRAYGATEKELLRELSAGPLQWVDVAVTLGSFSEQTAFEIPIACSYDMEVAANKYLTALEDGSIPIRVFFNGTAFHSTGNDFSAELLSWDSECDAFVPTGVWRDAMDACFTGQAWVRVDRSVFDALARYRVRHGFAGWEQTFEHLLAMEEEKIS
jgi:Family of unknown function (DUF6084)